MGRHTGILILLLLLCSCNKGAQPQAGAGAGGGMMDGPPPVAVYVEPVQMVDYAPAIKLIGETKAEQRAVLAAEVAGRVTAIRHRVGEQHLLSDGWLIRIDPATYEAGVNAADAAVKQARENLEKAVNGPREEDIRAQQAQVEAARARYQQAADNLKRNEALAAAGVIAETTLVAYRTEVDTAQSALNASEEVLRAMQAGARDEDRRSAEAAVSAAEANLKSARISLGRTNVSPEFDCVVSKLLVEEGQYVGPGTPLVEVVSAGSTEAWFNLPEEELGNVQTGADVEMRFSAFPDEVFHGAVISISPAANEQTRQFPLRVQTSDPRIRPGMSCEGRILKDTPVPTKMISMDSVIQSPLGTICWMMKSDPADPMKASAEQIMISTGARLDNLVVVDSDQLQPGMMIVTRGKQSVYPGAMLIPVNLMGAGAGGPDGAAPPEAGGDAAAAGAPADGAAQPCGGDAAAQPCGADAAAQPCGADAAAQPCSEPTPEEGSKG